MDARAALKHYIKMQLKHQSDLKAARAAGRRLTIAEFLAQGTFHTLEDIKAEQAIADFLTAHPDAESYYTEVLDEARVELDDAEG